MCFIVSLVTLSLRCEDYIIIDRGAFGSEEICGSMSSDSFTLVGSNSFHVIFRTSQSWQEAGFRILAACFDPALSK